MLNSRHVPIEEATILSRNNLNHVSKIIMGLYHLLREEAEGKSVAASSPYRVTDNYSLWDRAFQQGASDCSTRLGCITFSGAAIQSLEL